MSRPTRTRDFATVGEAVRFAQMTAGRPAHEHHALIDVLCGRIVALLRARGPMTERVIQQSFGWDVLDMDVGRAIVRLTERGDIRRALDPPKKKGPKGRFFDLVR